MFWDVWFLCQYRLTSGLPVVSPRHCLTQIKWRAYRLEENPVFARHITTGCTSHFCVPSNAMFAERFNGARHGVMGCLDKHSRYHVLPACHMVFALGGSQGPAPCQCKNDKICKYLLWFIENIQGSSLVQGKGVGLSIAGPCYRAPLDSWTYAVSVCHPSIPCLRESPTRFLFTFGTNLA